MGRIQACPVSSTASTHQQVLSQLWMLQKNVLWSLLICLVCPHLSKIPRIVMGFGALAKQTGDPSSLKSAHAARERDAHGIPSCLSPLGFPSPAPIFQATSWYWHLPLTTQLVYSVWLCERQKSDRQNYPGRFLKPFTSSAQQWGKNGVDVLFLATTHSDYFQAFDNQLD